MIDEIACKTIERRGTSAPFYLSSQKNPPNINGLDYYLRENRFALFGMRLGANRLFLNDGSFLSSANQR
ncbi:hypothetical protein [Brucella anthropi]|uniref:hypothetical protein n=1 Tax=Brucella anthropi TaxID=529 RepID=UPI00235F4529|nr:hypothetical protein [Brucella anthropi]